MSQNQDNTDKPTIKEFRYWWSLRIFIQSVLAGCLIWTALLTWIEHKKLPEDYVFERLPPIEGAWAKESGSLRATSSKVGRESVICSFPRILYGGGMTSCSYLKIPYGTPVTVIEVRIPMLDRTFYDHITYVQRISAGSIVFLERNDSEIAATWFQRARSEAIELTIDFVIAIYLIQIFLFRKTFWSK
jgi:hypothetical protein